MNSVFGREMRDMAQGTRTKQVVVPGEPAVEAFPIRTALNQIAGRHQLVHLHGLSRPESEGGFQPTGG